MRLFFALWPDASLRSALAAQAKSLQDECGGRATAASNLHLTLAFLGDIDGARLSELSRIAAEAANLAPFALILERIGWWPRQHLVWAAPRDCPPGLQALVETLAGSLRAAAFHTERRRFLPHVTLLRDVRCAPVALPCYLPLWRVSEFVLVASERSAGGARYRVLGAWPLTRGL
ncbi:MAG: RNA 2',3'-cyclic phosphodiesterase [Burkholderiales bacterium]|nr:RNA 2',3'-cyclic phosphodiesterase [Burkholderiales bacterium]